MGREGERWREKVIAISRSKKPNSITLAVSKLVADRFEAGRRPASNLSATSFESDSVMKFGRGLASSC